MSYHETAARIAGLVEEQHEPVTPDQLIRRFCTSTNRDDARRCTVSRGYCGLSVIGNRDRMVSGFDDGYDCMGFLEERGWRALAEKGDWPYVIYLFWRDDRLAFAEYCECDFTVWRFDDMEAAKAFYATLAECP